MDHREKIFIGLAVAAVVAVLVLSLRPVQVDIAPRPSKPLPDDEVGASEHAPSRDATPSVSAYRGMFLYPLAFARMPVISKRMQ